MISVYVLWGVNGEKRTILGIHQNKYTAERDGHDYDDSYETTEITEHEVIQSLPKDFKLND